MNDKILKMAFIIGQQQAIIYGLLDDFREGDRKNDIFHAVDEIKAKIEEIFYEMK